MASCAPSPAHLSETSIECELRATLQRRHSPKPSTPPPDNPIVSLFSESTNHAEGESVGASDLVENPYLSPANSQGGEQEDHEQTGEEAELDDTDDVSSNAPSTIQYGHEPFDTFQDKVRQLATEVFPSANRLNICIERIKGGSFNRIVGINISRNKSLKYRLKWLCGKVKGLIVKFEEVDSPPDERYIVRIPRDNYGNIDLKYDIATLELVGIHLDIPIPRAIHYDLTDDNVVQMPYTVQPRLQGQNASLLWDTLNDEQKKDLTKQITLIYAKIATITSHAGGVVDPSGDSSFPISINKFWVPRREHNFKIPGHEIPKTWTATTYQTPLEWIIEQCGRWRKFQNASNGYAFDDMWNGVIKVGRALEKRGFLQSSTSTDSFHLAHRDLMLYNILAEIDSPTTVAITGVLDWDSAVFAPAYMAYKAPFFLWIPESEDETEEDSVLIEPTTNLDKALKQVFEENAGEKYLRFAYAREAILARRMFSVLADGVFSSWEIENVNAVVGEWNDLHPEDVVKGPSDSGYCSGSEDDEIALDSDDDSVSGVKVTVKKGYARGGVEIEDLGDDSAIHVEDTVEEGKMPGVTDKDMPALDDSSATTML